MNTMFTLFTLVVSTIFGMIAYRFAGNHIRAKAMPVSAKIEFITKTVFSLAGGLVGLVVAVILYGILQVAVPLVILAGVGYLVFLYREQIQTFFSTGRL